MTVQEIGLLFTIAVLSVLLRRVYSRLVAQKMLCDQFSLERQHLREHLTEIVMHVERFNGGVHYRIHECRETTEAVLKRAPHVFREETGLVHWLSAADQFLTELDRIVLIDGPLASDIAKRSELPTERHPATIYDRIKYGPALVAGDR
ncbi:hypothetical protein BLL42_27440 (plasmid) [Pseudomonas frederiksbergensis]|uniref:Uncharacterized protein n=1 Tax=Pseudomonas frederiksbergensis TaxID=104087 RepID=A0A1J0EU92_9PSED|nr:hypothetical protein [Pseudomonas frederiksbergensis]APC19471.1 hypothetical protein BLL42_27440 [Pseudomonas frederiksbergensis]